MGERGSSPAVIFPSWHGVDTIPENAKLVAHGLDFGFTNDPTSLVSVYNRGHELYMKCRLYQTGLTNLDIGEKLKLRTLFSWRGVCKASKQVPKW